MCYKSGKLGDWFFKLSKICSLQSESIPHIPKVYEVKSQGEKSKVFDLAQQSKKLFLSESGHAVSLLFIAQLAISVQLYSLIILSDT